MTRVVRNRANWLVPCAVVGALLTALPQRSQGADDPRDWLQKMNQALATRNYDGTFFHLSEGRVETMRIVHRVRAGRVIERLQSLDGSGREFVRNNGELTCYLPDQHTVLVEPYIATGWHDSKAKQTIPADAYFVMGDNRETAWTAAPSARSRSGSWSGGSS